MEALAERVDELIVLTLEQRHPPTRPNMRIYSLGKESTQGISRRPRYLARWHLHMREIFQNGAPDVIFTHMAPIYSVMAAPYARPKGVPIVTWFAHPSLTWKLKLAHHLSARVVASLATAYPYKRDKLIVVGQGIDTDLFAPDGPVPSPGSEPALNVVKGQALNGVNGTRPEEPPIVLCAGRLSPVKDHPTLLKAMALLREQRSRAFRVVIIGQPGTSHDEPYVESLHEQVQALGLQDVVHFEPPVPMTELPAWYRRCRVHVNLTPTGFGDKVAWEAMACGKPCLVANEGFRETLGEYADWLLFRYRDPEDLPDRLCWALSLPTQEHEGIGVFLRDQVIKLHSLDRLMDRLVDLFSHETRTGGKVASGGTGWPGIGARET